MTTRNAPLLVVMCGRSFSGKSTLALALADRLGAQRVSLDAINEERGLRGGDGIAVSEWMRTNDEASARVEEALSAGRAVVVDDTSSPRFLRDRWRELAARAHAETALVFVDAPEELIRARLAANRSDLARHDVTDDVMDAHLGAFEAPETDEHAIPVDARTPIDASVAQVLAALAERHPS
ncbi:Gluconate kinase [Leifsonia sp. 98AMF]|uniref:AAA family ATPase n=1 Tax=unclassified Leifsonia TaxID=2663824 RepID=UPI00087A17DC|nr:MULTISPECIES: ATP-binding protein [unclassified Leifsonia]SDH35100.1 Gluconate kinase [Leifsonia sp. 197AMF]SDJ00467.1 Gluconate kinase [Leifsonia sp. 466MF]SDJ73748.1 Gluconate kinase [Leifsonia sp. 157MF]SDO03784.1 Gluconate kinase [Leifsonia sp. 509MF]SEN00186.1 Gluconate kinase [Leifsonia sp. 467MF]